MNEIAAGVRRANPAETGPPRHEAYRNNFCVAGWRGPPHQSNSTSATYHFPCPPEKRANFRNSAHQSRPQLFQQLFPAISARHPRGGQRSVTHGSPLPRRCCSRGPRRRRHPCPTVRFVATSQIRLCHSRSCWPLIATFFKGCHDGLDTWVRRQMHVATFRN